MAPGTARHVRRKELPGFTLIEILVVVAIVATLISVLLPSLAKAREQARSAACAMNLSQLCRAENLYQTQNQGWIPGSPLTTGFWWVYAQGNFEPIKEDPEVPLYNPILNPTMDRYSLSVFDYATPLRKIMLGAQMAPRPANAGAALGAWMTLWSGSTDGVFNCPSNPYTTGPYIPMSLPGGVKWPFIKSPSYLTMTTLMRGGDNIYSLWLDDTKSPPQFNRQAANAGQSKKWVEASVPDNYMPNHSKLGSESMKVFLADGTRYWSAGPPETSDYDNNAVSSKGNWGAAPPCLRMKDAKEYTPGPEYRSGRERCFRHNNKDQLNAAFFDGHVEALKVDYRGLPASSTGRYSGRAVDPKYYYPKGSIIKDPSLFHKNSIPAGTVMP